MRDRFDKEFGQFDLALGRPIHDVATASLRGSRGLYILVTIAENDGTVAAHQIDELPSIDIPQAAPFSAVEILRIAGRQPRDILMAPHPSGDHAARALPKRSIANALLQSVFR